MNEAALARTIRSAIPLIRAPARLPGASVAVLASHPGTRLEGFALTRDGTTIILSPAEFAAQTHNHDGHTWCVPFKELVVRLLPTCAHLLSANDIARLVGIPLWFSEEQQLLLMGGGGPGAARTIDARTRAALTRLEQIAGWGYELFDEHEQACLHTHESINARGIQVDEALAGWLDRAIRMRERQREQALSHAVGSTNVTVSSALKVGGLMDQILTEEGITWSGRAEEDVLRLLDNPNLSVMARAALEAILGHGRIAGAKVRRIVGSVGRNGRLREQFRIWGARTYRFTSAGVQLQNLPKPMRGTNFMALVQAMPADLSAAINEAVFDQLAKAVPSGLVEDAFAALLRVCLTAREGHLLVVLDWNAIEPRIRAWLSDDEEHLDCWRRGEDLYAQLISEMVKRPVTKKTEPHLRDVGKVADIGGGYQMGPRAFGVMCVAFGIDLPAAGLTAEEVVNAYRRRYHRLSSRPHGLWARLERGALRALEGKEVPIGQIRFRRSAAGHLDLILPNGAFRRYWNPTVVMRPPPWAAPEDRRQDRPTLLVARNPDEPATDAMYGGRWLENICQSIGREILMDFLAKAESEGFSGVAHCHDEAVFELPMDTATVTMARLQALAEETPLWAIGLPLKAEVFTAPFWSKSPIDWFC